ncbi:MFS transporter [Undibacterium sp. SXout20W]|uniref:MFS transporter n=1 Tax=Undibacterium sp. SXout20W TaxID=3413051 RepID=UPI003BF25E1D
MPSDLTRMSISTSPRSNVYPLLQGAVYAEDVNLTKPSVPLAFKKQTQTPFILAWVFCLIFYFAQYSMRSAPSVMLPELTQAFSLSAVGLSTLIGLYYYTYSAFALIAGAFLDRFGAKFVIPGGITLLALGSILFGLGFSLSAEFGRFLQGAGGAFAFTGAVYLATHGFPGKYLATAIGFTQCMGMLGGSAGQFLVEPLIHGIINWQQFWIDAGIACLVVALLMFFITPGSDNAPAKEKGSLWKMFAPYKIVLTNPQSYLCGFCAGLLFLPTTIGDMIWGVPFIRETSHLDFSEAVRQVSMVPLGWVIGCPLFGYLTDVMGRRKPVLIGGAILMLFVSLAILYAPQTMLPPYLPGLLLGLGSGAAMIPYTIIKEVNPDHVKGSATGAINFLVFTLSALMAPAYGWLLNHLAVDAHITLLSFQQAGVVGIAGIVTAIILAFYIKETGSSTASSTIKATL